MLDMSNIEFSEWLTDRVEERGWSFRELSRRADLSSAVISQVVTRKSFPGLDFCLGISRALDIPPERVFRKAGYLPARPRIISEQKEELDDYYEALDQSDRDRLVAIAKTLHEQQESYDVGED
jgi:transcriptional regulator with XRE-family HTH domain